MAFSSKLGNFGSSEPVSLATVLVDSLSYGPARHYYLHGGCLPTSVEISLKVEPAVSMPMAQVPQLTTRQRASSGTA